MATFKVKTKGNADPHGKSRVYFCCHPEDFDNYFEKICADVFEVQDCAIYYTPDMTEPLDEANIDVDLGQMNLFLVPVTFRLMNEPNRAMQVDIAYAKNEGIIILPFMMESGLDTVYSLPKNFGERQYLNPYSVDLTEISYEEKLKKILNAILISDEMAERVRAAFDAYIFLSYRKKDRRYANELMRIIHKIPGCRDIAIWYDEFLTPGESWKENIRRAMEMVKEKSNLFTLLVTPSVLEEYPDENGDLKKNYVMGTEYPEACKMGMEILATESVQTNLKELRAKFDGIPDPVKTDGDGFSDAFVMHIERIAISENDDDPEHNFLIGLAYLDGIDVEVNVERGLELITSAAETGLPEAMKKLYNMYLNGDKVNLNYREALKWAERLADFYTREYGEEHHDTLIALGNVALIYDNLGDYQKAIDICSKVYEIRLRVSGKDSIHTLTIMSNLCAYYTYNGDYTSAIKIGEESYEIRRRVLGEEHPDTLMSLNNIAFAYSGNGEHVKSLEIREKLYETCLRTLGKEHALTLIIMSNLGVGYCHAKNYRQGLKYIMTVYNIRRRLLGEEHPDVILSLNNIAFAYGGLKEYKRDLEYSERALKISRKFLGEEHPTTLLILGNIAVTYTHLRKYRTAVKFADKSYKLRSKVLGEEHPDTILALENLCYCYSKMHKYETELQYRKRLVESSIKAYGEDHNSTLLHLEKLAITYFSAGKKSKSIDIMERICELKINKFGESHEETRQSLIGLFVFYCLAFRFKKAGKIFKCL